MKWTGHLLSASSLIEVYLIGPKLCGTVVSQNETHSLTFLPNQPQGSPGAEPHPERPWTPSLFEEKADNPLHPRVVLKPLELHLLPLLMQPYVGMRMMQSWPVFPVEELIHYLPDSSPSGMVPQAQHPKMCISTCSSQHYSQASSSFGNP